MENLVAIILAGCGIAAALAKQPDGELEAKLLAKTQSAAQHVMEEHIYIDMDHDGACELIGVYRDEDGPYKGPYHVWYCSSDGQACAVDDNGSNPGYDTCTIEVLDVGDETHIVINSWNYMGTSKCYSVFALRDKEITCFMMVVLIRNMAQPESQKRSF